MTKTHHKKPITVNLALLHPIQKSVFYTPLRQINRINVAIDSHDWVRNVAGTVTLNREKWQFSEHAELLLHGHPLDAGIPGDYSC